MSFASDMKNELTRIEVDESNAKAELSALTVSYTHLRAHET